MNTPRKDSASSENSLPQIGMMSFGRFEEWEVSIDESTSGIQRWFLQIEGPSVYLYFEIASPNTAEDLLNFIQFSKDCTTSCSSSIEISYFNQISVTFVHDNEFIDCLFILVASEGAGMVHITVSGDNLRALANAIRDAVASL